jgi:hypothetical protein
MADYADISEVAEIEKMYANYPSSREIIHMCRILGIEKDTIRTIKEADAWAYYHELKARVEAMERKSA